MPATVSTRRHHAWETRCHAWSARQMGSEAVKVGENNHGSNQSDILAGDDNLPKPVGADRPPSTLRA